MPSIAAIPVSVAPLIISGFNKFIFLRVFSRRGGVFTKRLQIVAPTITTDTINKLMRALLINFMLWCIEELRIRDQIAIAALSGVWMKAASE